MLVPRGRSSRRNVYRGVVRTCQLSKYYGVTECVCAFGLIWKIVCVTQGKRVNEWTREREGGIKRKERRAVIPLWPWLRFHWACGVSWPCLNLVQEQWPAQTSYTHHYTDLDSTARLTHSFVLWPICLHLFSRKNCWASFSDGKYSTIVIGVFCAIHFTVNHIKAW